MLYSADKTSRIFEKLEDNFHGFDLTPCYEYLKKNQLFQIKSRTRLDQTRTLYSQQISSRSYLVAHKFN